MGFNQNLESTIKLHDQLTAPLQRITHTMMSTINTMQSLHQSVNKDFDTGAFDHARSELVAVDLELQEIAASTDRARQRQEQYNDSLSRGNGLAGGLTNSIMGFVGAYASIQGLGRLAGLSDTMASNAARFELIVDDGGTVEDLENKIYASAMRSRSNYLDLSNSVAKLGLTAKQSFSGMDEIVAFTELLNKNFIIGGAGAQEQAAAMYQLTQAMASGRLQGDEYRSIIENAPLLAGAIEDYMRNVEGATGSMKDWASQGLLTSQVIKNALFTTADEINDRFERMPMTWGQIWNNIVNKAIQISRPFLGVLSWMAQNWSVFEPILWGIVGVLAVYGSMLAAATVAKWAYSAAVGAATAFTQAWSIATFAQTAAQQGLNAALLASPVTWILMMIVAIIGVIYATVAAINKLTGSTISATGIIFGAFNVLFAFLWNSIFAIVDMALQSINLLVNPFITFANFLANVFTSPISSIIYLFQGMADAVLAILEWIASGIDWVFGSNLAGTIAEWRATAKNTADMMVQAVAPHEDYQEYIQKLDLSVSDFGIERWGYGDAWNSGYQMGEDFDKWLGGMFNGDGVDGFTGANSPVEDMAAGVEETAYNTGEIRKTLDTATEDLKFLRDLAEREVINRFTTAEVKIDMTGMTNKISSDMDLDEMMEKMTSGVAEAYAFAAEGVHV